MKTILVAAHELSTRKGGTKSEPGERVKVAVGTHIDAKVKEKLGLSAADVDRLKGTGAIVEVPVAVDVVEAENEAVVKLQGELAAAEKRATDAETRAAKAEEELAKLKPAS